MNDDELERLFRSYHVPLVRYLTRRLGDRDWAEEIAQETFLRALRQDVLTSERSWLFAVATNLVRDDARKTARRRVHLELLASEQRINEAERLSAETQYDRLGESRGGSEAVNNRAGEFDIDTGAERGDSPRRAAERALARKAVDALAERDRIALLMREEGLDYEEIADALGLSFKSVGTTLARARRRLTESFEALQKVEKQGKGANGPS